MMMRMREGLDDQNAPIFAVKPLDQLVSDSVAPTRFTAILLGTDSGCRDATSESILSPPRALERFTISCTEAFSIFHFPFSIFHFSQPHRNGSPDNGKWKKCRLVSPITSENPYTQR
jgi:hypothetical protein